MPATDSFLEQGKDIVLGFATEYTGVALLILAGGIVIGLGIWGTIKAVKLFRKSAA